MRSITAALLAMVMLEGVGFAQRPNSHVIPSVPAPRDPLPRFTITPRGGSLAPIGLPLPHLGLGPLPKRAEQGRHRHRHGGYFYSWPLFYVP